MRVDTWMMPSHTQAARVAEGVLDLAICWVSTTDLESLSLEARLVGVDRLYALSAGRTPRRLRQPTPRCSSTRTTATWSSWNRFAEQFAADTGARKCAYR